MRRNFLKAALAAIGALSLGLGSAPVLAQAKTLKISHQFPGGTIDEGDFRDRMVVPKPKAIASNGLSSNRPQSSVPVIVGTRKVCQPSR